MHPLFAKDLIEYNKLQKRYVLLIKDCRFVISNHYEDALST
jgi:hypothetical protein